MNMMKSEGVFAAGRAWRKKTLKQFGRDEDGSILILTLLLLVVMLVVGGMAVDFMRFESRRALLQSVSDRAVLAAAELDQLVESDVVVREYFEKNELDHAIDNIVINDNPGSRAVRVDSQLDINTIYLRLIGIDQLEAPAQSAAIEGTGNIEISLVLDISGSMGTNVTQNGVSTSRMNHIKTAATSFVDTLLIPEYRDEISVSLVTYSANVNVGDGIFRALNTTPDTILENGTLVDSSDAGFDPDAEGDLKPYTNPTRCVEFNSGEYSTTVFNTGREYKQLAPMDPTSAQTSDMPYCPNREAEGIIPLTQDPIALKTAINDLRPTRTTAIHLGMKWGVSLVDPSMRNLLAGVPGVDPVFAGARPADHNNASSAVDTAKYVILMTDGSNIRGWNMRDSYWNNPFWRKAYTENSINYWRNNVNNHPAGTRPTWNNVRQAVGSTTQYNTWLQQTCDAARDAGIKVFAISMGAPTNGENQMKQCATDLSYFFNTEGQAISDVFTTIAQQITDLRLNL